MTKTTNDMVFIGIEPRDNSDVLVFEYLSNKILCYIKRSRTRKRLAISIYPDLSLEVKVPIKTRVSEVVDYITSKASEIAGAISSLKSDLNKISQEHIAEGIPDPGPLLQRMQYENGEKFLFLGKVYRLSIIEAKESKVVLDEEGGVLSVFVNFESTGNCVKSILKSWTSQMADKVFSIVLDECYNAFCRVIEVDCSKPVIKSAFMKRRWGSLSSADNIVKLNYSLVHADIECIRHVILHELCHLVYDGHGKDFQGIFNLLMPKNPHSEELLESYTAEIIMYDFCDY